MNIGFADWLKSIVNPNLGTAASCLTIWQGCAFEGLDYKMVFQTEANANGGVDWNRSADFHGIVLPLFFANWKSDTYNGAPVANETFPLRGGGLGYASVLLAPSAQNNGIVWTSVGTKYNDIPVSMPGTIVFRTSQTSESSIQTTGSFTLDNGLVVGTIYMSGTLK